MADRPKTFGELFAAQEKQRARSVRVGDEVTGTMVAFGEDAVFVDLGAKAEAVIERAELVDRDGNLSVAIGDSIRARVAEVRDGQILLRTRAGRSDDPLVEIARAHELRIPVMGKVRAVNKGGVEVDAVGLTAFCPISQLDLARVEDAGAFVGREL
ncbi:MAG TPA: S1 RNA-binding domain-containing protein, partial [Polyangiaceae bacterium]|nr:S1 RNA-binding domain-containing protein [Polyangiaceae bacterium]